MKTIIVSGLMALALGGCATTQREEVRSDRHNVGKQLDELAAAKRDGTINEVREEQKDLRQAEKELREDQKQLYRPERERADVDGLRVGQRESIDLLPVPELYRTQFADGNGSYYRADTQRVYQFDVTTGMVTRIYPIKR